MMRVRTAAGFLKFRPVRHGSRVAVVAPASPFDRAEFDAGLTEIRRLGFVPVYDEDVFARAGFVAGSAAVRGGDLMRAFAREDVDAIIAVRGGYGSAELLPALDAEVICRSRTAFIGYSDVTSVHSYLGRLMVASVHGAMIEGRLARGAGAYDERTFLQALGSEPLGELAPDGVEALRPGEAHGPLVGGTLMQLLASFGTPWEFQPPADHVLFIDEVGERPYRIRRMLTQWRQAGRLAHACALVFGQLPRCDEPGGLVTARDVVAEMVADFPGPVLFGFPSGHTTTPLLSVPFGVSTRVLTSGRPRVILEEAGAL